MVTLLAAAAQAFDVDSATRAYLDTLQGAARARSDAYVEGGYWLILFGTLVSALVYSTAASLPRPPFEFLGNRPQM